MEMGNRMEQEEELLEAKVEVIIRVLTFSRCLNQIKQSFEELE